MIILEYLLEFSRFVIGFTFVLSLIGSIRDFSAFRLSIENFRLLPQGLVVPFALTEILLEVFIIILLLLEGPFLFFGFSMASILLLIFTIAIITLLVRKIQTSCNCFGKSENPVTQYDILRNLIFLGFSFVGLIFTLQGVSLPNTDVIQLGGLAALAFMFTLLNINLSEIFELFK